MEKKKISGGFLWALAAALVAFVIVATWEPAPVSKTVSSVVDSEIENLANAIKRYEMDYSTYPLKNTVADSVNLETDVAFMRILLGRDEALNPRGNVYYEGKAAKKGRDGLDYSAEDPVLVDPWGRPYRIVIDGDYDGKVTAPDGSTVSLAVIVYSLGDDGVFDKKDPKSW